MEAEARLIIGLSMNKIMTSRTKRGGASLHRNLLVASVLVKARTFYLASAAAAEQRKSVSVEVEAPPSSNTERVEIRENESDLLSNEIEDMDVSVLPEVQGSVQPSDSASQTNEGNNNSTSSNDIAMSLDNQSVPELETRLCENMTVTEEQSQYCDLEPVAKDNLESNNESDTVDLEQYKENIAPSESATVSPRRKRGYSEVEYAVISIGGAPEINTDGNSHIPHDTNEESDLGYSSYSSRSNICIENNDMSHPSIKRIKLDLVDISTVKNQSISQRLDINLQVGNAGLRSGGSCGSPTDSVYASFASGNSSLRSPPMLIGTV